MEKKNTSVLYNGLIWGLILSFASIIFNVILYMMDQNLNQALGYAGIIISLVVMILGIRSFRDNIRDGVLPFGTAFGFLMIVMIVSTIIGDIYTYILWTVIDPDIVGKMLDLQTEKMLEKGIPEEAMEQAMTMTAKFMQPGIMIAMATATGLFFGAILSLIIAAIFKKDESSEDPILEEETPAAAE
ncbi:MAG TPA: DUF4199 domain-containing protein [Bacteroides sp.]|nr:DUF4199 domain-containing protein [Bacteroides sp.]